MQKLVLRTALFLGIFYLIFALFIGIAPMAYMGFEYPMWKYKMDVIEKEENHDFVILGDSRALSGIDPAYFSDKGISLAVGGGSPFESYLMLKKYAAKHISPEKIVISFAPFHFEESDCFWYRTVQYGLFDITDVSTILYDGKKMNHRPWEKKTGYSTIEYLKDFGRVTLTMANVPFMYKDELKNSLFVTRLENNIQVYNKIAGQDGFYILNENVYSDGLNFESQRNTYTVSPLLDKYFRLTLETALGFAEEVYFVATPMNSASMEVINDEYLAGYYEYIAQLKKSYLEVTFYADILEYPNSAFCDPSHLNKSGAIRFSQYLAGEIK